MSISTPYSDFQSISNIIAADGGPWRTEVSDFDLRCWTGSRSTGGLCNPYGCLFCDPVAASTRLSYNVKWIANVSFPVSQFGNADNLDFTLSYNFYYACDQMPPGVTQNARVTVGSWSNILYFSTSNHTWLWYTPDLTPGSPFTQFGTTTVSKSRDGTTGYVPIIIDYTMTRPSGSADIRNYLIGRTFSLTARTNSGLPLSPVSGGSSTTNTRASSASSLASGSSSFPSSAISMTLSGTLSVPILPGASGQPVSASIAGGDPVVGSIANGGGDGDGDGGRTSKAAIIGGVLGGLAVLVVFALVLFLLYKRKMKELQKREEQQQQGQGQQPAPVVHPETVSGGASASDEGGAGGGGQMRTPMAESGLFQQYYLSASPFFERGKHAGQYNDTTETASSSVVSTAYLLRSASETQQSSGSQPTEEERRRRRSGRSEGQSEGGRRRSRRRRRRQTLASGYSSTHETSEMDVPPPAYSDVNGTAETMNGHRYDEGDEEDEDIEEEETDEEEEVDANRRRSRRPAWGDEKTMLGRNANNSSWTQSQSVSESASSLGADRPPNHNLPPPLSVASRVDAGSPNPVTTPSTTISPSLR